VNDHDIALRNLTYRLFVEAGRAPTAETIADASDLAVDEVLRGWARLHDAHALVLQSDRREIRMANPGDASPTAILGRECVLELGQRHGSVRRGRSRRRSWCVGGPTGRTSTAGSSVSRRSSVPSCTAIWIFEFIGRSREGDRVERDPRPAGAAGQGAPKLCLHTA
jgi:hypothetical protein